MCKGLFHLGCWEKNRANGSFRSDGTGGLADAEECPERVHRRTEEHNEETRTVDEFHIRSCSAGQHDGVFHHASSDSDHGRG